MVNKPPAFRPLPGGGRVVEADTPHGRCYAEWDHKGRLVSHACEARSPERNTSKRAHDGKRNSPCILLKAAIRKLTGETPCGQCLDRCKTMDQWGWWKCWRNRRTIAAWLKDAADKRAGQLEDQAEQLAAKAKRARAAADAIDEDRALTLLRAAWRELRR